MSIKRSTSPDSMASRVYSIGESRGPPWVWGTRKQRANYVGNWGTKTILGDTERKMNLGWGGS